MLVGPRTAFSSRVVPGSDEFQALGKASAELEAAGGNVGEGIFLPDRGQLSADDEQEEGQDGEIQPAFPAHLWALLLHSPQSMRLPPVSPYPRAGLSWRAGSCRGPGPGRKAAAGHPGR